MSPETHKQIAGFIWEICNLLRGPYKRNEYRKVILPMTVLRRFDCILYPTKEAALKEFNSLKGKPENIIRAKVCAKTKAEFYNVSKLTLAKLLDDPNHIASNLNSYIHAFSPNVRQIMERFDFGIQVEKMNDKNLLYEVVKAFTNIDLTPKRVDNMQMGYIFEELIRIGAEQSNEEAGEHFTPREVIRLMVNLLLMEEKDLAKEFIVKTFYDPACGTGGMLSTAEQYILELNNKANPKLFGQDWNDEAYAICKSDMLIKGEDADNIKMGDIFTKDGFPDEPFDYMLANPPFGVTWKQQEKYIRDEYEQFGYEGRFGAGLPRVSDGSLLFLQHMISKMEKPEEGGSRIGIVFNGSPLFAGDAGSGESEIRRWIIENDWLEAIIALPDQLFYNTGIYTYIWILNNTKGKRRKGKVQLIDARYFFIKMKKSLGNKRHEIGDGEDGKPNQIETLTQIYGAFKNGETRKITIDGQQKKRVVSRVFDNDDFGYNKITVERPLKLNFQAAPERLERLEHESAFKNLATSKKKNEKIRQAEIGEGKKRQQAIRDILAKLNPNKRYKDRKNFIADLKHISKEEDFKFMTSEIKAILSALSERDETAEVCVDKNGEPEPDTELRDTEMVPLKEKIDDYFEREVKPYVPDAWIDHDKTKVGYEIPLTRHFYTYEPPRPLEEIEADITKIEKEIVDMIQEVVE